ncbi:hypothetical protein GA0115259_1028013 [Streptomyces sp. MnatMP-M17]|nr:hypothetical protein GA0115259_1028013 [Streptomyces sp. MnatMP-M17]
MPPSSGLLLCPVHWPTAPWRLRRARSCADTVAQVQRPNRTRAFGSSRPSGGDGKDRPRAAVVPVLWADPGGHTVYHLGHGGWSGRDSTGRERRLWAPAHRPASVRTDRLQEPAVTQPSQAGIPWIPQECGTRQGLVRFKATAVQVEERSQLPRHIVVVLDAAIRAREDRRRVGPLRPRYTGRAERTATGLTCLFQRIVWTAGDRFVGSQAARRNGGAVPEPPPQTPLPSRAATVRTPAATGARS